MRRLLGLVVNDGRGRRHAITYRKVEYMFGATVRACASPREVIEFGGFHVDAESGEILDVAESDSEPITIELVGNRVLASLWEYIGIALPSEFALDSRAQETHYATKAFGGIKDVDPCWVANGDKNEAAGGPATTKRLREQHARWAGQQAAAQSPGPGTLAVRVLDELYTLTPERLLATQVQA